MSEPTLFGHSSQRVTWIVIVVGLALLAVTMIVVQDDELLLYSGIAIGVGMIVGSSVVNSVAVKRAEHDADANA